MATTPNLRRKLQQTLGAEAAGDLAVWMQSMDAHRTDIGELRREMQLGFAKMDALFDKVDARFDKVDERFAKVDERFAKVDERFARVDERFAAIDERFARVDGRLETMGASFGGQMHAMSERFEGILEKGLREQTRFLFVVWSVLLAAIIGLYARPGVIGR